MYAVIWPSFAVFGHFVWRRPWHFLLHSGLLFWLEFVVLGLGLSWSTSSKKLIREVWIQFWWFSLVLSVFANVSTYFLDHLNISICAIVDLNIGSLEESQWRWAWVRLVRSRMRNWTRSSVAHQMDWWPFCARLCACPWSFPESNSVQTLQKSLEQYSGLPCTCACIRFDHINTHVKDLVLVVHALSEYGGLWKHRRK